MAVLAYPEYLRNPNTSFDSNGSEIQFVTAMRFDFFRRISDSETNQVDNIFLYMPLSAKNPTNVEWDQKGIGRAGMIATKILSSGGNWDDVKARAGEIANTWESLDIGDAILNEIGGDAIQLAQRQIKNPFIKMMFRGLGMRNFEYQFKFTPKSEVESRTIDGIVKRFRQAALPGRAAEGLYLTYPEQVRITYLQYNRGTERADGNFARGGYREIPWMNKFKPSVITQLEVDYTSAGHYVPMRDGFPSETTLTMQFTETEIVTRGEVERRGDEGGF